MKHVVLHAVGLSCLLLSASPQAADAGGNYPSKPVRFIVPYPPGGAPDILARNVGNKLGAAWGQQLLVDNRAGANGIIATETTARAPADGHTIMMGSVATHAINPALYGADVKFDSLKDFSFITQIGYTPLLFTVHNSVPASNPKELIALAKGKPGHITFGSSGSGSAGHLAGEMFKIAAGVNITHVPYKGMAQASLDLVSGQILMTSGNILNVLPHIRAGKVKAVGVTGLKRSPVLPDTPAIAETIPGFDVILWWGVMAPAGVPRNVIRQLNEGIAQAVNQPELKEQWAREGSIIETSTPEHLAEMVRVDRERWARVIKTAGIKPD